MRTTGRSRRDGIVAATVALAANGLIVWSLQALLSPASTAVDEEVALQVVWLAAAPRRTNDAELVRRPAPTPDGSPASQRPRQAQTRPAATSPGLAAEIPPARSMSAVYLQQARQWAQIHPLETAPADPFANRPVALPNQAATRFRLSRQRSVASVLAMVGETFGGAGYTTDDCELIRGRVIGLVAAGDVAAAQDDLDYERRHCRP